MPWNCFGANRFIKDQVIRANSVKEGVKRRIHQGPDWSRSTWCPENPLEHLDAYLCYQNFLSKSGFLSLQPVIVKFLFVRRHFWGCSFLSGGLWNRLTFRNFSISSCKLLRWTVLFFKTKMDNHLQKYIWNKTKCIFLERYQNWNVSELYASVNSPLVPKQRLIPMISKSTLHPQKPNILGIIRWIGNTPYFMLNLSCNSLSFFTRNSKSNNKWHLS